jgi:hypothetical protein
MRLKLKAFIETNGDGRLAIRFAVPAFGKWVTVSPAFAGNAWAYARHSGGVAHCGTLAAAICAAKVDGETESIVDGLAVDVTLDEARKITELLKWYL